jgi:predicted enzyme related to lactoylglutathione lyase
MTNQKAEIITDVIAVAIPVDNQDRALEFYTQVLGLEKRLDGDVGGGRWLTVAAPGSTTEIALVTGELAGTATSSHTGIRLGTRDADALHARLRESGVDADPEVTRMGEYVPPMFSFRDPDGNALIAVELP